MNTSNYFSEVTDPRVTGRCLPLLSDILMIGLCTYLAGGTDYESFCGLFHRITQSVIILIISI